MLCCVFVYAQGDEYYDEDRSFYQKSEILTNPTVQAPDVAAFQKVNFIPVSNYTGRTKVSIPIFTVKTGGISVPISLSYNSGGVKINDIPSAVGSNWSLNAGGVISKIIRGVDDFMYDHNHDFPHDLILHCSLGGFLYNKNHTPSGGWWEDNKLIDPDVFIVSAPGINTSYTHTLGNPQVLKPNGTTGDVFETTGQQNIIKETRGNSNVGIYAVSRQIPGSNDYEYIDGGFNSNFNLYGINSIDITNTSGLQFIFDKADVSQYNISQENKRLHSSAGIPNDPVKILSNLKQESYHLSKIKDFKSNKEVFFDYETYKKSSYDPINDSFYIKGLTNPFYMDPITDAKSVKYPKLHRLTKIRFDNGSVEFIYGLNRQDVIDEKALTQIIIKDLNGKVIKKVNLEYSYKTNFSYTSAPQNKRLQLNKVYTTNAVNTSLPGYLLTYNSTPLPPRGSWGKDFLGYHNGTHNTSNTSPKPHIYFYPDSGKNSLLPVSKGSGYYLASGNFSLASNLTYAKAGILEKIEYPTGGFSEFEYELNQFKVENATINGGGLRIKTQKIKDELGNEQILDYEYKEINNSSSGSIVSFSNYVDLKVKNGYTSTISPSSALSYYSLKVYSTSQAQAELTNGSFVGYSRVIVKNRINNGYSEFSYTSPKQFPDLLYQRDIKNSNNYEIIESTAKRNGIHSSFLSKEIFRGNLLSKKIYNKNNTLLKKVENEYSHNQFSNIQFQKEIDLSNDRVYYNERFNYDGPKLLENVLIPNERNLLTKSITTDYLEGGSTSIIKETVYDAIYPLIKENKIIDNTKTVLNKYYYPHNSQVSGLSYMNSLRGQNRYSEMIHQEAYHDGQKIFTERINYHNFGNNLYLPNKIYTAKGTQSLEEGATIDKRDANGNILQYHTKEGIYTSFIYGYGNTSLLAKIENEKYNVAVSKLPISITALQNLDNESNKNTLIGYFNTMRNALPNARITSYTYIPSVGVHTITDNRGKTMSYVYDKHHRLSLVKDTEGKIVKRYEYNYKNQ